MRSGATEQLRPLNDLKSTSILDNVSVPNPVSAIREGSNGGHENDVA